MASFSGRVILITGASAGIGEGIALHFAKLGAKLSLTGRDKIRLDGVAKQCKENGLSDDDVLTSMGDVTNSVFRKQLIEDTVGKFSQIDVLVNNAGIMIPGGMMAMSEDNYDLMMDVNMKSHMFLSQLAVPHLEKVQGNIVNVSSICGSKSMPELGVYCLGKAAMDMFTQCLALELAPRKIRVNAVSPGTIVSLVARREYSMYQDDKDYSKFLQQQVARHPLGRVGQPQDVAEAISYLASDAASFITGQSIYIDGGRHCVSVGVAK